MKNNFELMETFMIRTPSLPINLYFDLIQDTSNDYISILKCLPEKYCRILKESIQISSLSFYNSLKNFKDASGLNKEHLLNAEYKYFIRTTSRCTPYGLHSNILSAIIVTHLVILKLVSHIMLRNMLNRTWVGCLVS